MISLVKDSLRIANNLLRLHLFAFLSIFYGLLDLTAAFDIIEHSVLLQRLEKYYGISATALEWFKSYLSERTQTDDGKSEILHFTSKFANNVTPLDSLQISSSVVSKARNLGDIIDNHINLSPQAFSYPILHNFIVID